MALRTLAILVAAAGSACAAPIDAVESDKSVLEPSGVDQQKEDLNAAASSSYGRSYSDWGGYPSASSSGYSVTGYGSLDNKYNNYNSYYGGYGGNSGYSGYAGSPGYGGYAGSPGYSGYAGSSGYSGYAGSPGYGGYAGSPGYSGYSGSPGYGSYDYNGYSRYGGGYGLSSAAGNGGYGGYGGNGGLTSYYGYNSPYNQGGNHLGFGYYKRTGNIYNSGVTPSLVTGYRGYSR